VGLTLSAFFIHLYPDARIMGNKSEWLAAGASAAENTMLTATNI
jgi:hypothetical protein